MSQMAAALLPATTSSSFFMVQLSDPQLGLEHGGSPWHDEQAMLNATLLQINRLQPRFAVLTGDMQNWFPTAHSPDDQGGKELAAVQQSLSLLSSRVPLRATLPGNHDVGDVPTATTLKRYAQHWGGSDRGSFDEDGIRFVAIDSQLYWNSSMPGVQALAGQQTGWLSQQLDAAAQQGTEAVVLLSHIPPFIVASDEPSGWANWPQDTRDALLRMSQAKPVPPSLVVAGHFHANLEGGASSDAYGARVEVVTSSSVGCPIRWNGSDTGTLAPDVALAVATEPSGSAAFMNWVVRNGTSVGDPDFGLKTSRIAAGPGRSGVRLYEFDATAGYRHRWFTLRQLEALQAPLAGGDASPLAGAAFTKWTRRSARASRVKRVELRRL